MKRLAILITALLTSTVITLAQPGFTPASFQGQEASSFATWLEEQLSTNYSDAFATLEEGKTLQTDFEIAIGDDFPFYSKNNIHVISIIEHKENRVGELIDIVDHLLEIAPKWTPAHSDYIYNLPYTTHYLLSVKYVNGIYFVTFSENEHQNSSIKDTIIEENKEWFETHEAVLTTRHNKPDIPTIVEEEEVETVELISPDEYPMFQGKEAASFAKWVAQHLQYPELAKENGIEGSVIVWFTIMSDGKLTDIKLVRGINKMLDDEVVRVVNSSPKWTPGKYRNLPIKVTYNLLVNFYLPETKIEYNDDTRSEERTKRARIYAEILN